MLMCAFRCNLEARGREEEGHCIIQFLMIFKYYCFLCRLGCFVRHDLFCTLAITDNVLLLGFQASKAALISFYESMRVELAPEICLTIVTLGYIESEMIQGKHLSKEGVVEVNTRLKDVSNSSEITAKHGIGESLC